MLSAPSSPFSQVPLDNHIPENARPGIHVPSEPKELEENEVIPKRVPSDVGDDVSNKVSMSSAAHGSNIFERTEVLAGKAAASISPSGKADRRAFSLLEQLRALSPLRGGWGGKLNAYQRLLKNRKGIVSLSPSGVFRALSLRVWHPELIM